MITLTRAYRFPAAHVLRRASWSDEANQRTYGKCANPGGHGHDYGLEVTLTGEVDARTGFLLDPERLDAIVAERIVARFSNRLLNDDPLFARDVPTAENVARLFHHELEVPIAQAGDARLLRVRVIETPRNSFVYGEPG